MAEQPNSNVQMDATEERKEKLKWAILRAWTEHYFDDSHDAVDEIREIFLNGYRYVPLNTMDVEQLEQVVNEEELICPCDKPRKDNEDSTVCENCGIDITVDDFIKSWND